MCNTTMRPRSIVIFVVLFGCNRGPEGPATHIASNPTILKNGNHLDAAMSDDELLRSLGIDAKDATQTRTQGKDGYSIEYRHGDQRVTITRSLVSGVSILADGPTISGQWSLGGRSLPAAR
jgi:hypothetical protein